MPSFPSQWAADPCGAAKPWPGDPQLFSSSNLSFAGGVIRVEADVNLCTDCAARCYLEMQSCIGFAFVPLIESDRGACTYFSSITTVEFSHGVEAVTTSAYLPGSSTPTVSPSSMASTPSPTPMALTPSPTPTLTP